MKLEKIPFQKIIKFEKVKEIPNIYDLTLTHLAELKKFRSIEASIFIYPFSRKISSKNIAFNPFEEYVKDILGDQRSAYFKINRNINNLFGIFLGLLIVAIFYHYKPAELVSIESIVSVFGAYIIGKELWTDIDKFITNLTKRWRIQHEENKYAYQLDKNTMLPHYSHLAKKERYGITTIMPEKMHFINQSNSQTVRLFINTKDLKRNDHDFSHLLAIRIDPELIDEFEKEGFMLTVRLNFNRPFLWWNRTWEFFNSLNKGESGSLDRNGKWAKNAIFYRRINGIGRVKHLFSSKLLTNNKLIDFKN